MKKIKFENVVMWASISLCVAFFTAITIAAFAPKTAEPEHKLYPMTAMVFELDEENDLVIIEDFNGNLWDFEGIEEWMIGNICSVIMDDIGTETIFDDEIVSVRYDGWIDGAWGWDGLQELIIIEK